MARVVPFLHKRFSAILNILCRFLSLAELTREPRSAPTPALPSGGGKRRDMELERWRRRIWNPDGFAERFVQELDISRPPIRVDDLAALLAIQVVALEDASADAAIEWRLGESRPTIFVKAGLDEKTRRAMIAFELARAVRSPKKAFSDVFTTAWKDGSRDDGLCDFAECLLMPKILCHVQDRMRDVTKTALLARVFNVPEILCHRRFRRLYPHEFERRKFNDGG